MSNLRDKSQAALQDLVSRSEQLRMDSGWELCPWPGCFRPGSSVYRRQRHPTHRSCARILRYPGTSGGGARSALALSGDLETVLRYYLRQPLSDFSWPEQRNASGSEPLLGDAHQLLERDFARIAEELDQTCRFPQACPASKVVNHSAATRRPVA